MVGRAAEVGRLEAALDTAGAGEAACIALEGEPGIGKTRLLTELRQRAEERGHIVLHGQAAEFERDLPFGIITETLDPYLASHSGEFELADAGHRQELGAIFPSLRLDSEAPSSALGDERYRAHRAVRELLELLAEKKAIVLALDDLHWADDASIELLSALLRRPPDAPVLIALAFRPGSAPERLTAALAAPLAGRVGVEPLSESEAVSFLGEEVDARSATAIYRHGGGNPFYLEQLARMDQPALLDLEPHLAHGAETVPTAVAASLAEELANLSPSARRLLEAAAVSGEPFGPDVVAAVAELEQGELLLALDELLEADLVRQTQVPRRFIFRHPLIRRNVYESIGGGTRLAAHSRAATALAASGAPAAERAHHVEQAADRGDEEAISVLLEAAEQATARAPAVAIRWLDASLRLLPDGDRERQIEVRVSLASALRSIGEFERCQETLLETIELLPPDSIMRRVELTTWCAAVEHWLGHHEAARTRLLSAWDDLADPAGPEGVGLQIELAVDGLYTMDLEQTIEMGHSALESARKLGLEPLIASAAAALALGEASQGLTKPARKHREEAIAVLDRLPDEELTSSLETFYYIAWVENYLERYDEALAHIDRALSISRSTGQGRLVIPLMLTKGYPLELQGRLAEAAEMCDEAVEAARLSANSHFLYWALFELGFACYFAGDLEGAIAACEESLQFGDRLTGATIPSGGGGPGWALAITLVTAGETERGLAAMHALGGDEIEFAVPVERCFDWEGFAIGELAAGNVSAAEGYAARAEELAGRLDLHLPAGLAARTRATILLAQGKLTEAVEIARVAVEECSASGAHLQAAFARSLLGNALAEAGDRGGAIEEIREAERVLDACGSIRERDAARRELRKLGVRREARGPAAGDSGIDSLTKRELEIAGLVTDRKTNKEVAADLFLSEKTIESHLRNIFFKLGVSSRVEVARALERERREQAGSPA